MPAANAASSPADTPTVRRATERDAPRLAQLTVDYDHPTAAAELVERLRRLLADDDHDVFVAELPGSGVVGFVHVAVRDLLAPEPCAEILGLATAANARRRGVASGLMNAAETWARDRNLRRLLVRSNLRRTAAHEFYHAIGLRTVKDQRVYERRLD